VATPVSTDRTWRFGVYEVDTRRIELRRNGSAIKLREQPFAILVHLLEHAGEIVSREELRRILWPSDTFVDFDHSLSMAVMNLRDALGDSSDTPLYIETIPKRGYRFIAPVETPGNAVKVNGSPPVVSTPSRSKPNWGLLISIGACVLVAGTGWIVYLQWHAHRLTVPVQRTLTQLTFGEGLQTGVTWSPDGRYIAYASDRGGKFDIWVQAISGGDPIQITKNPGTNWQPDWSPDGRYIAYRSEEGEGGLYIVPALGGERAQRRIATFGYEPRWSPDSSQILFQSSQVRDASRAYVVKLDGSPPREVSTGTPSHREVYSLAWHPDGRRISAWIQVTFEDAPPSFFTMPIEGGPIVESKLSPELMKQFKAAALGPATPEFREDSKFSWAPSGKAIYFERTFRGARNIWRMTVDPVTLQPSRVDRLTTSPGLDTEPSLSQDGSKLAFTSERQQIRAWAVPFDATKGRVTGPGRAITTPAIEAWAMNISRDGKKVSIWGNRAGKIGTWETSTMTGQEKPLPVDSCFRDLPIWSPDGKKAIYQRYNTSTGVLDSVMWSSENRSEESFGPWLSFVKFGFYDWSPDGKSVLGSVENSTLKQHGEIWEAPLRICPKTERGISGGICGWGLIV
jgi:Tol biopolymer transport system component/DNA-binding winged helix-turn-helix (wHTH) protein